MQTGVRNLDDLLNGGLPEGSVTIVAGPPGAGKTILTQQICFHNASPERPVLYFNTLSEPTAKTLRYLSQFGFFDADKFDSSIQFIDLGDMLRTIHRDAQALSGERVVRARDGAQRGHGGVAQVQRERAVRAADQQRRIGRVHERDDVIAGLAVAGGQGAGVVCGHDRGLLHSVSRQIGAWARGVARARGDRDERDERDERA